MAADERRPSGGSVPGNMSGAATLVLSTVGTDVLKGYVTLDGARICKAEIQLLLPSWSRGHPASLHLGPESPVELAQISICSTLISLAKRQILSMCLDDPTVAVLSSIRNRLAEAIAYCKQAIAALENADFSYPLTTAPFLGAPDDLTICFGMQNARIVAVAYTKSAAAGHPSGTGSHPRLLSRTSSLLSGAQPTAGQPETIARVDSIVPALTAAHEMLLYCMHSLCLLKDEIAKVQL